MWNKNMRAVAIWALLSAANALFAQQQPLTAGSDASSSVKIELPADSPVTLISAGTDQSRVTPRGGMLVLDLHMSLTLRNSGTRRVRGVTMLVSTQESTPGGKGSVTRPCIDVPAGQNFTLPIDIRLVRPVQQALGPLVRVQLDGVLFDDLSFYGPNRLNSQRAMTFMEVEAQRDRAYYKQVLQAKGEDGLRREVLSGLASAGDRPQLDVALSHNGRAVGSAAASSSESGSGSGQVRFAFLSLPDAPVLPVQGQAAISGNEASSPWIEVQNLDRKKSVRYVEIGWIVKDYDGNEYLAGSVPGSGVSALNTSGAGPGAVIQAGQRGRLEPDATLKFSHGGRPIGISGMTGFVNRVEFADGKVWVPSRRDLDSSPLLRTMSHSTEEQRLLDIYAKQGLAALVAELSKY
jgi:hypothetical protein